MQLPKLLILGAGGQVGQALQASSPGLYTLITPTRADLDLTASAAIEPFIIATKPALVINCAAYNFVDKAEQERERCRLINATAVARMAAACERLAIPLVHFSTDYVFEGKAAGSALYTEDEPPCPVNHYGQTKLAGERAALAQSRNLVLRVSWVFSEFGANMGSRMLAAACAGQPLRMASDQWGSPTYAGHIAETVWALVPALLRGEPGGLYHLSGLSAVMPAASRWDLAAGLVEAAIAAAMLPADYRVDATTQAQWQALFGVPAASRPDFSAMANDKLAARLGRALPHWQQGLAPCVTGLLAQS
ncbi:dTDP-4-dehydrorhamnose reductase [Simiduia agarivorans]|uniref:dTDP-4-dehydrorhamnose reductase n=1 Tax=Simiduia agarivorans (strain DSM 21679 / JCM 13881 / BCRC 17597 / SA1) TaxID=1117647 RepID=K4KLH4_SIMAS|nr:dTDP-4-dehydrorhamnose reductase [Simiduia agarivorans]AFU99871.1 dTDP-4-dehydrorhamnose reductase [Simiduia agarivorans SA1 = DSM 21679]